MTFEPVANKFHSIHIHHKQESECDNEIVYSKSISEVSETDCKTEYGSDLILCWIREQIIASRVLTINRPWTCRCPAQEHWHCTEGGKDEKDCMIYSQGLLAVVQIQSEVPRAFFQKAGITLDCSQTFPLKKIKHCPTLSTILHYQELTRYLPIHKTGNTKLLWNADLKIKGF